MSSNRNNAVIKRLKCKTTINALFESGKTVQSQHFVLHYHMAKNTQSLHSGVSVAKRHFKRAVDRNRIKRQMRIAVKVTEEHLVQKGSCMLIYTGRKLPKTKLLINDCQALFKQLQ